MIGFDDVSKVAGDVSNALGGGVAGTPAGPTTPKYFYGVHIDQEDAQTGGATALTGKNVRDSHPQIEFIHFGNVHTSYGNLFVHDSLKDNEKVATLTDKSRPRGLQFRAALEREAILLSLFIECAQTVLALRDEGMGGLGALASTAGALLGGGAGNANPTKPGDLDAPLQKVMTAAGTLNVANIEYHDTHKAGMDFNEARTDYRALLAKIIKEPPKSDPASSLLGAIPSVGGQIAGPVADVITFTQGIVFKAPDIKIKGFALLAAQQEKQIEKACNEMTLASLTPCTNPIMPVWHPTPDGQSSAPAPQAGNTGYVDGKENLADKLYGKLGDPLKLKQQTPKPGDAPDLNKSFFDVAPLAKDAAGKKFVAMAFEVPKPSPDKSDPVPLEMGALASQAFIKALGMDSLPSFVDGVVSKINDYASEFVTAVYQTLLIRAETNAISEESLLKGEVEKIDILGKIKALTLDKLGFFHTLSNASLDYGSYTVSPKNMIDQAGNKLEDLVNDKVAPIMDKAIGTAMGEMAKLLELARQDSTATKTYTMEWYLGRLPWARSSLFFNLFFPFWNVLMDCATSVIGGPAGSALKAVVETANKMKGIADEAKSKVDKAKNIKDNLAKGVTSIGDIKTVDQNKDPLHPDAPPPTLKGISDAIPVARDKFKAAYDASRLANGQGMDITDYDTVAKDHQWVNATDPAAAPVAAGGGAGAPAGGAATP